MSLFNDAKLILTPNGYKAGKLYALKPFDGSGDFDVVRATKATRVNKDGLIEEVDEHIPRLDYTENSCPCILVEEQRTNLHLFSESFDESVWGKTRITISQNLEIAPDGSLTADKMNATLESGGHALTQTPSGLVLGNVYTRSIFVKKGEYDYVRLLSTGQDCFFDINNGVILGNSLDTPIDKSIEKFGNGWFRISITFELRSIGSIQVYLSPDGTSFSFLPAGAGLGVYIWGSQLEEASTPSSYIPTTTASVTRNADLPTVTPPVGTTQIIETFSDNTTNTITTIPSTYQLPVGRIKHIVMK